MGSASKAQEFFAAMADTFVKSDWENSPESMTYKLRDLVETHKNNTPPELVDRINRVIVNVQKFELRIHHRCRFKKPDAPIHPDPFWIYNGYDDVLGDFTMGLCSLSWKDAEKEYRKEYPDMLSSYGLHFELLLTLDVWRTYCQALKDAPAEEAMKARARTFAAEIKALQEEVATWKCPPFPN